jgi:hypothetical protein
MFAGARDSLARLQLMPVRHHSFFIAEVAHLGGVLCGGLFM